MIQHLTILFVCFALSVKAQESSVDNNIYLDTNNNRITADEFVKIMDTQNVLVVDIDSLKTYKVVSKRLEKGKIDNFDEIASKLQSRTAMVIDKTKPLVVIYFPGKDRCNSSGSATKSSTRTYFNTLSRKVNRIARVKPIYIYRTKEGTEKDDGIIDWHKDPENIIEKTFFKFHYPCSSYVLVNPDGTYIAFFGEWSKESLWKNLEELVESK